MFGHSASSLSLGLQSGVLLAVPIPEEHAASGQQIEDAIKVAVAEARYGKSVFDFLSGANFGFEMWPLYDT